eukprot:494736_1
MPTTTVNTVCRYCVCLRFNYSTIASMKTTASNGEIKQLISLLENDKNTMDEAIASELINDIMKNVNYSLEINKKYIWTVMINLCDYHKLPEIYSNLIWKDIQYYHKQNHTEINQQCLSSLVLYYANTEQFKQIINVLYWLDNEYNINTLNKSVILNDKIYNMLLSKLNKVKLNRNLNKFQCLEIAQYIHLHLTQYSIENIRIYNTLISVYAKYGDIHTARNLFNGITMKQTDTYNAIIGAYVNLDKKILQ